MKSWTKMAVAAASLMGAGLVASGPANAQVHIGVGAGINLPGVHVGVGVDTPAYYYGPGYYPPGPCDGYDRYYAGDCGYAVYNGPIVLGGVSVGGPHYYRWYDGMPYFWYRGGWHNWNGWSRASFDWDHGEGFGWQRGHWDRGWGNAHWRGERADFREDRGRGREDFHEDRGRGREDFDHDHDRGHDRGEHRGHGDHDR
jgi:hypothetical protein